MRDRDGAGKIERTGKETAVRETERETAVLLERERERPKCMS